MPSVYFGFPPKSKGATKLATDTTAGQLEPVEPSSFKVYARSTIISPSYSMIMHFLGHLLCVLARPKYSMLPLQLDGDVVEPPTQRLPFRLQNFAFALAKGRSLTDEQSMHLEDLFFTSMKYRDRVVWLKEEMNVAKFKKLAEKDLRWDPIAAVPQRYLNPSAFVAFQSLLALTTRVCELFHRFAKVYVESTPAPLSTHDIAGFKNTQHYDIDNDTPTGPTDGKDPKFTKPSSGVIDDVSKLNYAMLMHHETTRMNHKMSAVVHNPFDEPEEAFVSAGKIGALHAPGTIFKFEPKLALPDVNLISDVIGRRFLTCLGTTRTEQFNNLEDLKSGLGALRLTEVGDELTHLYKCVDIAIEAQCGCVPFFSGDYYEGCVVSGGYGSEFHIGKHVSSFLPLVDLKNEFLVASSHGQALALIANRFSNPTIREEIMDVKSMMKLRLLCLDHPFSSDDRDYIVQKAAALRFSQTTWALSPAMIKRSLVLMSDLPNQLESNHPISRLCLFSKDPVLIALSVFGERSAPSWNIPNGALQKVISSSPPSLSQSARGSGSRGLVNDAGWVMEVRRTDLMAAAEDFRTMASLQGYRSLPSAQAKKQGYLVFSRERMGEFWSELRVAYRHVDPSTAPYDELERSLKRAGDNAGEGASAGVAAPKAKKLKF